MKFVLLTGTPQPERVQAALAAAKGANPDCVLILPDNATAEPVPHDHVVIDLKGMYDRKGDFLPIRFARIIAQIPQDRLDTIILDASDSNQNVLDQYGNRAPEVTYHFMKQFFMAGPRPTTVIHFVRPTVLPYTARAWAVRNNYPPIETPYSHLTDHAMKRLDTIVADVEKVRAKYHPWDKMKRIIHSKITKLYFWR